jgi:single-strand DNA-binding protein
MSTQMQLVIYEGYLGGDPEMRYTKTGQAVTNFSLGSSEKYKNPEGDYVSKTTWLRVTTWGKLAETVNQYCKKGTHVIVTGKLTGDEAGRPSAYMTKDGKPSASFDVTAQAVNFIGGTSGKDSDSGSSVVTAPDENDEIPF